VILLGVGRRQIRVSLDNITEGLVARRAEAQQRRIMVQIARLARVVEEG
jgi:hypothetical protein